jgi:Uncharacterised protein family (UPF0175)
MTHITVQLPEDIARRLESRWKDLPRAALESLALEAYRSEILTTAELRQLLGYETSYALDGFLKEHRVYLEYTPEELEREAESSRRLSELRQRDLRAEDRKRRAG